MPVIQFQAKSDVIDLSRVQASGRQLRMGLIAPPQEDTSYELVTEHDAEPIKSMEDIIRISKFLIKEERYRDNMLFIVGINFGLRVSDLRMLRFSHLITDSFTFKETFPVLEKKTKNTRKRKKNRYITINNAVIEAVTLYLEKTPNVRLSDYMFRSQSNHGGNKNEPLDRKSFGYHQMVMSGNDPRKLLLLQQIFGHSSTAQTMNYIGITGEEIEDAYRMLNLGSSSYNYLVDGGLYEAEEVTA